MRIRHFLDLTMFRFVENLYVLGSLEGSEFVWPMQGRELEALEGDFLIQTWDATSVDILGTFIGIVRK